MRKRRTAANQSSNSSKDGDQNEFGPFRHYVRKPPKARQLELFALQQQDAGKNSDADGCTKTANGTFPSAENESLNSGAGYSLYELTAKQMPNDYESTDSLFDEHSKTDYFEENGQTSCENSSNAPAGRSGKSRRKNNLACLNSRERNMRRLESNERERMRMHSLNDAFQVRKKFHSNFLLPFNDRRFLTAASPTRFSCSGATRSHPSRAIRTKAEQN